jgi:hypothetical protein
MFFLSVFVFFHFSCNRNICAWLFIDKDAVRSTCATKTEVLKFLLWVSGRNIEGAMRRSTAQFVFLAA